MPPAVFLGGKTKAGNLFQAMQDFSALYNFKKTYHDTIADRPAILS